MNRFNVDRSVESQPLVWPLLQWFQTEANNYSDIA